MIDPSDPKQVEDAVNESASELCKIAFLDVRDTVGVILEEAAMKLSYLLPDGVIRNVIVTVTVNKEMFEQEFLEFAKERLMNDAKRIIGLPTSHRNSQFPLSTDEPEDPDQAAT